jgi:hypothetical protein
MNESDVRLQREHYRQTAASYQQTHVCAHDEHGLALDVLIAFARHLQVNGSFLDVGAGTGRAMHARRQLSLTLGYRALSQWRSCLNKRDYSMGLLSPNLSRAMLCTSLSPTIVSIGLWKLECCITSLNGVVPRQR